MTTKMRYIVTGSAGFIGTTVCHRLTEHGVAVHGFARTAKAGADDPWPTSGLDLGDRGAVVALVENTAPDCIIHLAGRPSASRDIDAVQTTTRDNLLAAINILEAAVRTDCRKVVVAGSMEEPYGQNSLPVPSSPYAASKWAAAGYARMFHTLYDLPVAVARIGMVYGPGRQDESKFVPYVCKSVLAGRAPEIASGIRQVDWVFVEDVADGLIRMAEGGPGDGTHVDLGTGVLTSTGSVANLICSLSDNDVEPVVGAKPARELEQETRLDPIQTRRQLRWAPRTTLKDGLRQTLEWFGRR